MPSKYFLFVQGASSSPLPVATPAPASRAVAAGAGAVVESGPVVYDDVAADEEEEEEEETCVSAMELLGGNGQCVAVTRVLLCVFAGFSGSLLRFNEAELAVRLHAAS